MGRGPRSSSLLHVRGAKTSAELEAFMSHAPKPNVSRITRVRGHNHCWRRHQGGYKMCCGRQLGVWHRDSASDVRLARTPKAPDAPRATD